MAVKNFKIAENHKLWDMYVEQKLEEGRPQTSINQYKPVLLALEAKINKKFNEITSEEIIEFLEERGMKNENHLRGFYVTVITNEWIGVSKELAVYLIPLEYRKIIQLLLK